MPWLLIAISSYLLGSIPWGFLFARAKGIDIRQKGSGNIGAANAFRVMGKKWGYLVFICDFLKGFLAVESVSCLLPGSRSILASAASSPGLCAL
jgi:acyl phosphate:glycerol-3-phosphate acyltransferase